MSPINPVFPHSSSRAGIAKDVLKPPVEVSQMLATPAESRGGTCKGSDWIDVGLEEARRVVDGPDEDHVLNHASHKFATGGEATVLERPTGCHKFSNGYSKKQSCEPCQLRSPTKQKKSLVRREQRGQLCNDFRLGNRFGTRWPTTVRYSHRMEITRIGPHVWRS